MDDQRSLAILFGTREQSGRAEAFSAGPTSLVIENGAVRNVCWRGIEILRGVAALVRDAHWGTFAAEAVSETATTAEDSFLFERRFEVADGAAHCSLQVRGDPDGRLTIRSTITAQRRLEANRAGLVVLHPIAGVAGTAVEVRHSDGSVETLAFPLHIMASQPVFDIAGLRHVVDGVAVEIGFEGEVFEMEDQRNWSDASFKTYCRPLAKPAPFVIEPGGIMHQSITLHAEALSAAEGAPVAAVQGVRLRKTGERMPRVALAMEEGSEADAAGGSLIAGLKFRTAQVRLRTDGGDALLRSVKQLAAGSQIDVEAIIPVDQAPARALAELARRLTDTGIAPDRVLALPEPYLASYQPDGLWPTGPTPASAIDAARAAFPDAKIGGGVLTNFTELNRCRPDPSQIDYLSHGTTAIVHAADDRSVVETLEALPQIFASAETLAGGKPYRLGLVSIGMRSNPYGPVRTPDPGGRRQAMAHVDPRQRGLYAAAWAVGVVASTAGSAVEALSLCMPAGPFGITHRSDPWPAPLFDETPEAVVYPLFHVVRAFVETDGVERIVLDGLPPRLVAAGGGRRIVIANLGQDEASIELPGSMPVLILDEDSYMAAVRDPAWLDRPCTLRDALRLGSYAVAFIEHSGEIS